MACLHVAAATTTETSQRGGFNKAAISSDGVWRAAVQVNSGAWTFYRSSNGGGSWSSIAGPDDTYSNFRVAVETNGDLWALAINGTTKTAWKYTGSWSAGSTVINDGLNFGDQQPVAIFTDGTTKIAMTGAQNNVLRAWYSTNGTTWTAGGTSVFGGYAAGLGYMVFVGGIVHLVYTTSSAGYLYQRWSVVSHTWASVTTTPSFPGALSGRGSPTIFSLPGSTSELYIALTQGTPATKLFWLFKTTDSGDNWSTVTSIEAIGSGLEPIQYFGVTMGSDSRVHVWRSNGTKLSTIDRGLTGTADWGTIATTTETIPNSGSFVESLVGSQRNDGSHSNVYEAWFQATTTGGATPTELILLTCLRGAGGWHVGGVRIA